MLRVRVLGSGTSSGVPTIGCDCAVCRSDDPRDNRLRPSVLLHYSGRNVLIDSTPDFREQALRARLHRLDAIIYTHEHADHILGLDDIRPFNYRQGSIPLFGTQRTFDTIQRVFSYAFEKRERKTHVPQLELNVINETPFSVFGVEFVPVPLLHGTQTIFGFRVGNFAYLTDHSSVPETSLPLLQGLDVLFLDALRHKPHPTHSTVLDSIATAEKLRPRATYFTHICHDLGHAETEASLPPGVHLAYDGLELEIEIPA